MDVITSLYLMWPDVPSPATTHCASPPWSSSRHKTVHNIRVWMNYLRQFLRYWVIRIFCAEDGAMLIYLNIYLSKSFFWTLIAKISFFFTMLMKIHVHWMQHYLSWLNIFQNICCHDDEFVSVLHQLSVFWILWIVVTFCL